LQNIVIIFIITIITTILTDILQLLLNFLLSQQFIVHISFPKCNKIAYNKFLCFIITYIKIYHWARAPLFHGQFHSLYVQFSWSHHIWRCVCIFFIAILLLFVFNVSKLWWNKSQYSCGHHIIVRKSRLSAKALLSILINYKNTAYRTESIFQNYQTLLLGITV
jgi:hypothetical protein